MRARSTWIVLVAVIMFGLSAAPAFAGEPSTLQQIVSRGKVIVGVNAYLRPLEFTNPQSGEIVGLIPDLVNLYAKKLDVKVEYSDFKWAGLFPALETKKVDFLAGNITTTIPRTAKMEFTHPFLYTGERLILKKSLNLSKLAELNSDKITFGVSKGSVHIETVEKRFPKAKLQRYDTFVDSVQALKAGRIDASIDDEINVLFTGLQGNEATLMVLPDNLWPQTYRFACRLGDVEMRRSLDVFFEEIKLTGEYKEIYEKWLGQKWEPRYIGH
jgi:polar amino acid transport system substrate-binding protein